MWPEGFAGVQQEGEMPPNSENIRKELTRLRQIEEWAREAIRLVGKLTFAPSKELMEHLAVKHKEGEKLGLLE